MTNHVDIEIQALEGGMPLSVVRNGLFNKIENLVLLEENEERNDALYQNVKLLSDILSKTEWNRVEGYSSDKIEKNFKGKTVRVRKGSRICAYGRDDYNLTRSQKVKVHHTICGRSIPIDNFLFEPWKYVKKVNTELAENCKRFRSLIRTIADLIEDDDTRCDLLKIEYNTWVRLDDPIVRWPGTGGYWRGASINDVDIIDG